MHQDLPPPERRGLPISTILLDSTYGDLGLSLCAEVEATMSFLGKLDDPKKCRHADEASHLYFMDRLI